MKRLKEAILSGDTEAKKQLSKKIRGLLYQTESMLPEDEVDILSTLGLLRKLTLPENEQTVSFHRLVDEHGQVHWIEVEKGSLAYGKNGVFVGDLSDEVKRIIGEFEDFEELIIPDINKAMINPRKRRRG